VRLAIIADYMRPCMLVSAGASTSVLGANTSAINTNTATIYSDDQPDETMAGKHCDSPGVNFSGAPDSCAAETCIVPFAVRGSW
jgi:hypothetical protein